MQLMSPFSAQTSRKLCKVLGAIFSPLLAAAVLGLPAHAMTVTYGNPFSDYGTVPNSACGQGICAAAEAENSFIFLSNYYPTIYANTRITTGFEGSEYGARDEFATGVPPAGILGYYNRKGDPDQKYIDTLNDWLNTYAPATSYVVSDTDGNQGANLLTMFIGPQLEAHEDVELFIFDLKGDEGHVISPVCITYDPQNPAAGGSMSYQDPNFPTTRQTVDFIINPMGEIQFMDPVTGLGMVTVTAGFAKSPVPQPENRGLVSLGALALFFSCRFWFPT